VGGPIKGERRKKDRPNAVTLIILRLRRELRLCQVAIISYTSWLFLNRPIAPVQRACPIRGHNTSNRYYPFLMYTLFARHPCVHKKSSRIGPG
jgi:hypothetical protein